MRAPELTDLASAVDELRGAMAMLATLIQKESHSTLADETVPRVMERLRMVAALVGQARAAVHARRG